jgi:hypothetical protein
VISIPGLRVRGLHLAAAGIATVIVFSVFFMGSVSAYVGKNPYVVSLSRGATKNCSDSAFVTATVRDAKSGKPIKFQAVLWSLGSSKSSKDKVSPRSSTTNGSGHASTSVRFGPHKGTRKIIASVKGFKFTTTATCSSAVAPTPKPTKTPKATQPAKTQAPTPKPNKTPKATSRPAQSTPQPTAKPTKKPHKPTPTPADILPTPSPAAATLPVGGITPSPIGEVSPSPTSTLTAVVDATGDPAVAVTTNPQALPPSDAGQGGGGGGGFDFGLIALLVIGALGALVVIFLVRQPTRARR